MVQHASTNVILGVELYPGVNSGSFNIHPYPDKHKGIDELIKP